MARSGATPARPKVGWLEREPRRKEVAKPRPFRRAVAARAAPWKERVLIGAGYLGGIVRVARWLLARRVAEVAIRIAPARVSSWDFRRRMRDV
jgi:hypothetical protein